MVDKFAGANAAAEELIQRMVNAKEKQMEIVDRVDYYAAKAMQTLLNSKDKRCRLEFSLVEKALRIGYLMDRERSKLEELVREKDK